MDAVDEYDFTSRTGTLFMSDGSSYDMMGCIDLFKKIDPAVKHIRTIAGIKGGHRVHSRRWESASTSKRGNSLGPYPLDVLSREVS